MAVATHTAVKQQPGGEAPLSSQLMKEDPNHTAAAMLLLAGCTVHQPPLIPVGCAAAVTAK